MGHGARCATRLSSHAQRGARGGPAHCRPSGGNHRLFDITILGLDVSAALFEYDDESYMEAILRELALVAGAYLRGEGLIEQKRGMLRTRPVLMITVNGNEWTLGRRTSRIHYPEDTSTWGGSRLSR